MEDLTPPPLHWPGREASVLWYFFEFFSKFFFSQKSSISPSHAIIANSSPDRCTRLITKQWNTLRGLEYVRIIAVRAFAYIPEIVVLVVGVLVVVVVRMPLLLQSGMRSAQPRDCTWHPPTVCTSPRFARSFSSIF